MIIIYYIWVHIIQIDVDGYMYSYIGNVGKGYRWTERQLEKDMEMDM